MCDFFMYGLKSYLISPTQNLYTEFDYVKREYKDEFKKIKEYYYNANRFVNNTNIFSRLLNTLPLDIVAVDSLSVYNEVKASTLHLSKQFGITSTSSYGMVFHRKNILYQNADEIMLLVDKIPPLIDLSIGWRDISPIKVIYSEDNDLNYYLPDGSKTIKDNALCIYEINLNILFMQYHFWAKERYAKSRDIDSNVFIKSVVLPNILVEIMNTNLLNRYFSSLDNVLEYSPKKIEHPFPLHDFTDKCDKMLIHVAELTYNKRKTLPHIFLNVPMITKKNALQQLEVNFLGLDSENLWGYWLSRIFIMERILHKFGKDTIEVNSNYTADLLTELRIMESRKSNVTRFLSEVNSKRYEKTIKYIYRKIGRR